MAAETLREFVASIGYKVDESSERRFTGSLEAAVVKANLLSAAIEAMATTVAAKVGDVATQFEQLFYQSSRVGASASSIRAFEYAVSQLGGTIEGANSALEDFAKFARETPGATAAIARILKIPLEDAKDSAKFLLEANEALTRLSPALQARYRETFHLGDYNTSHALQNPAALGLYGGQLERDAASGITGDAMKRATEFEQAWRGVWARIGTMAEGGESKLLTALTNPMQKFSDWLDKNSPQLNDAIGKMATAVGSLTTAWVDDLDKVHWDDVATKIDSAATSIANFAGDFTKLMSSIESKLPLLEHLIAMFIGARTGAMFGPLGAGLGAAAGWIGADLMETESNPETSTVGQASTLWGNVKGWWGSHAPGLLGGSPGGGGGGGKVSAPTGTLKQRGLDLMSFLVNERGWTPAAAAIAVGNAQQESGVNPSGPPGDNGQSWGMFQWNHERLAALKARYGDKWQTARAQYEFFADEAEKRLPEWKRAGDLSGAGYISHAYEGYGDNSTGTRVANAEQWLKAWGARGSAAVTPARPMTPTPAPTSGSSVGISPTAGFATMPSWAAGAQWDAFNQSLPVGPGSTDSSRNVNIGATTTTINVTSPDPQSAAAMVGMHLDRSANDVSRNLQGAFQ
jgi:Phage tail lysozyme